MKNLKIILGLYLGLLANKNIYAACYQADPGFEGGCIQVEENYRQPNGKKVQLFYQTWNHFDAAKKTIIFLNGGPANSLTAHSGVKAYQNLSDEYNVLFYDQRGVGRSGSIDQNNIQNIDFDNYTTPDNVEDLAVLIDVVVGGKAIILGHSYGGELAYAFSIKYPEKLHAMINFAGSTDYSIAVKGNKAYDNYVNTLFSKFDQRRLDILIELIKRNLISLQTHGDFNLNTFYTYIWAFGGTYQGIEKTAPLFISSLLNRYKDWIDEVAAQIEELEVGNITPKDIENPITFGFDEPRNEYVFYNIMCREYYNPVNAVLYDNQQDQQILLDYYMRRCASLKIPYEKLTVFDTRPQLNKVNAPILIMGADHDVAVPLEIQESDYIFLKTVKNNVHFVTLKNAGHMAFEDVPKCIEKSIRDFLKNPITENKAWTCSDEDL